MIKCHDCQCMYTVQRKYGVTNHCLATTNHLDVTYYCEEANKDKENLSCPLINADHYCGIDISHVKDDSVSIEFPLTKVDKMMKALKECKDKKIFWSEIK